MLDARRACAPIRRVLVAEDEALVSMYIEDELARAGFVSVGPFATCGGDRRRTTPLRLVAVAVALSGLLIGYVLYDGDAYGGAEAPPAAIEAASTK